MAIEYLRGGIFLFVGDEGHFDSLVSRGYYSPVPDHEIPYDLRLEIQDRLDARGVKGSSARQSTGTNEAGKNCWAPNKPCGKACRVNCKSGSGTVGAKTKKAAAQQMVSEALAKKKGAAGGDPQNAQIFGTPPKRKKSTTPRGKAKGRGLPSDATTAASAELQRRRGEGGDAPQNAQIFRGDPQNAQIFGTPSKRKKSKTPRGKAKGQGLPSDATAAASAELQQRRGEGGDAPQNAQIFRGGSRSRQLEAQLAADPFFADIMRRRRDSHYDSFDFIPYYATTGLPTLVDPFGAFR